jgi:hypothetical protein
LSQPRKHHYLSQFYLRGFSVDGISLHQIWKRSGRSVGCRIKDAAAIRDFHELDFDDAADPLAIERELAVVEGTMASDVASLLRDGIANSRALVQTIGFVALQRMRVPAVKRHIEQSLGATIMATARALERQGKLPPPPPGLEEALKVENLGIKVTNWKCMELMFGMGTNPDVINIMCNMRASLFRAPAGSFVTCDQPVALYRAARSPYGVGPASRDVEISMPLSSDALLLLTHSDEDDIEREATTEEIREFNRRTFVMADEYVYTGYSPAQIAASMAPHRELSAGLTYDEIRAPNGTYFVMRCTPVYPADL